MLGSVGDGDRIGDIGMVSVCEMLRLFCFVLFYGGMWCFDLNI